MTSPSLRTISSPPSSFSSSIKLIRNGSCNAGCTRFNLEKTGFSRNSLICGSSKDPDLIIRKSRASRGDDFAVSFSIAMAEAPLENTVNVADKIRMLVAEFASLTEPIDRVKRLLRYAATLLPMDESALIPANRVPGCTTQVWLDVWIDELGKMRFRADSDSEISKGFCSCLIWILDGAQPHEVLALQTDDLAVMNVGVHGKTPSRVNTWQNVLIAMQNRTKAVVAAERDRRQSMFSPFHQLLVTADGAYNHGNYQVPDYSLYYDYTI